MKIKENVLMLDSTRGSNCFIVFDKENYSYRHRSSFYGGKYN